MVLLMLVCIVVKQELHLYGSTFLRIDHYRIGIIKITGDYGPPLLNKMKENLWTTFFYTPNTLSVALEVALTKV